MTAFRNQAICFANQYAKFKMPLVHVHLDGNETLADNVCDNAGLRHAWLAYEMWVEDHGKEEPKLPGVSYSSSELFYISYGQVS